jgi:hypothetical protein
MPHRQFIDTHGNLWTVWDVHPSRVERELDLARSARAGAGAGAEVGPGRSMLRLEGAYAAGWLCFESGAGKRRLTPIPTGWESLSAAALVELCDTASGVRTRLRRDAFDERNAAGA